ncbi:NAD(P)-dependent oxidoreductase [Microbacterium protaetiae]|uniref:NAD(P)-dependent oxidoreductase n=1 Tax=Microbacterium protaetiae TaxID=2509458 RepID=A0A4V0YDC1_9MICO|nr:NAD(P)-dependent oxidoreductase [Microbacterium protaetiae]QAY60191.1 NAD(P)-dependent oxidoreductase [Microbacterium protaetiae]
MVVPSATSLRVAVTGAAGSLARDIIPGLVARGHEVIGIDRREEVSFSGARWETCSIADRDRVSAIFAGCDAVIHLAGIPLEDDWESILAVNIDGTQAVLEAARRAGVRRVILASSIHAAGFVPVPEPGMTLDDAVPVRPNTFYGVSKAALEALGSLYHDRWGLEVVCVRIASRFARPQDERMLRTWLSPADAVRLFDAALTAPDVGYRVVWGVSANTRGYLSHAGGASIGFEPHDDAEAYAAQVEGRVTAWDERYIGGSFCSPTPPRFEALAGGAR